MSLYSIRSNEYCLDDGNTSGRGVFTLRRITPKKKIIYGIACFIIAVLLIILMIILYHETSRDAKRYTVPVTGTVQHCKSYKRTTPSSGHRIKFKTYYEITVSYETYSAQQRNLKKLDLIRPYQEGEEVALMYDPDTDKAVLKSETVQDTKFYIFLCILTLTIIAVGVLCVKQGRKEM